MSNTQKISKILDEYSKLQKQIYKYFGYTESWLKISIADDREYLWMINENDGIVQFAETKDKFDTDGDYYKNEIFTYCGIKKHVYRAEYFTMIVVDTRTDGNKFLQIFDNSKEVEWEDFDE